MEELLLTPEEIAEHSRKRAMSPEDWCRVQLDKAKPIIEKQRDDYWAAELEQTIFLAVLNEKERIIGFLDEASDSGDLYTRLQSLREREGPREG